MLGSKDDQEIRERARKILEARMDVHRSRKRNCRSLTMRELTAILGDRAGVSHATKLQEAAEERAQERQRRKEAKR